MIHCVSKERVIKWIEGWKLRGINLSMCTVAVLKCYNDLKFDRLLAQFLAKRIIMDRRIRNSILKTIFQCQSNFKFCGYF